MKLGDKVEIAKACSCLLDLQNVQEIPGYKPKRKLQVGETVTLVRIATTNEKFWKVKSKEGIFYIIRKTDLVWNTNAI